MMAPKQPTPRGRVKVL